MEKEYASGLEECATATIELGKNTIVLVRLLAASGKQFIDIRKWHRWAKDGSFHPTPKGFCMAIKTFSADILPVINQLCNNTSNNGSVSPTERQGIDNPMPHEDESKSHND